MAANRQQGSYLAEFLAGFTALPAGLVLISIGRGAMGVVITIVGLALLVHSCFGFYRIKKLEYSGN